MAAIRPAFCGDVLVAVSALTMIWTQSVTSSAVETDGVRMPIIRATIARGVLKLGITQHLLTS